MFYSWQSDSPEELGRAFVQSALQAAVQAINSDPASAFDPELDHDTRGVPGAPVIVAAILQKIDQCSVFVADVSLTFARPSSPARKAPNPNVLVELGYALRRLGQERVLMVMDSTYGGPESLPFNLRGARVVTYSGGAAHTDRHGELERLASIVREELDRILTTAGLPDDIAPPVRVRLNYTDAQIASDRHDYRLHVALENAGRQVANDWVVELRFPAALLDPYKNYPVVPDLGVPRTDGMVVMRQTAGGHSGALYPGDVRDVLIVDYLMTHALWDRRQLLFDLEVLAVVYVNGRQVDLTKKKVRELQKF